MKIYQSWKRNKPDTLTGESITLTITYCSKIPGEIDELQKKMVPSSGVLVMDFENMNKLDQNEVQNNE